MRVDDNDDQNDHNDDHNDNHMDIHTNHASAIYIDSSQNVGIGCTPTHKFNVQGPRKSKGYTRHIFQLCSSGNAFIVSHEERWCCQAKGNNYKFQS